MVKAVNWFQDIELKQLSYNLSKKKGVFKQK